MGRGGARRRTRRRMSAMKICKIHKITKKRSYTGYIR
jgi:hypothetical protein